MLVAVGCTQESKRESPAPPAAAVEDERRDVGLGASTDEVRSVMGYPKAQMQKGSRIIWMYDRGSFEFEDGRVVSCNLLHDEALAARESAADQRAAAAATLRQRQELEGAAQRRAQVEQERASQSQAASQQASREYRKSLADRDYAQRQASIQNTYDRSLVSAKRCLDERLRAADDVYRRCGGTMDALAQLSQAQASARERYDADVEAAKQRHEADLRQAKADYDADLANLDAVPAHRRAITVRRN
jgi:hypothetical protein